MADPNKLVDTPPVKKEAAPVIEFANTASRILSVPLEWPLLIDGESLEAIIVRRLTGREVGELQELMGQESFSDEVMMEFFTDQPQAVIEALDQDDFQSVKAKVLDFLPKRVRDAMEAAQEQYLAGGK